MPKAVILSVSEIFHDFSEKYMRRQFFGGILHFCYSALNAYALKLSFSAFLSKMQVPYEYLRSQTLASKFARLALTQRQYIRLVDSSVGYFANAQYDVRSPIGTSCHFAYAADAPLLSLSRHFPRFSGGIYPEGGSEICLCEEA